MDSACTPDEPGGHTQCGNEMDPTRKTCKRKAKRNVEENCRKWVELERDTTLGARQTALAIIGQGLCATLHKDD